MSDFIKNIIDWAYRFISGFGSATGYLLEPIIELNTVFGNFDLSILELLSFGGLTTFLVIAIAKWVIA